MSKLKTYKQLSEFAQKLASSIFTLPKILITSNRINNPDIKFATSSKCVVLGNGPSLKDAMPLAIDALSKTDTLCVNYFAQTEFYSKIKPKYYIIAGPELFDTNMPDEFVKCGVKIFTEISQKTSWPLVLILPINAKKFKPWQNLIKSNKHIQIHYINITSIEGFGFFKKLCFNLKLGLPRPHNVLIPAIFSLIHVGYKEIWLLGADHSWLKDIHVTENNEVFLTHRHFYAEEPSGQSTRKMHNLTGGTRLLHEMLEKFYYSFRSYFEIRDYAYHRDIKIFNATKESYIDAFPRRAINDLNKLHAHSK